MDIMQILQDICKNPEDHDKGTNITHLMHPFVCDLPVYVFNCSTFRNPFPVQITCVGTLCPPCSALPVHLADTATPTSRCCPSCSLDPLLLCCLRPMKVIHCIDGPSMTSVPSCRALCSLCVRETLWDVKPPLCPVCHNRYRSFWGKVKEEWT